MANWCLPPKFANLFLKALQDGNIDVEKMATMESADRRALLAKYVGEENAHEVNAAFEQKLLLKDWKRGMLSWVKGVTGLSDPAKRDMVNRITKMDKLLNPADEKMFLADYAAKRLGTEVTVDEAKKITDLAQKATKAREASAGSTFGMSEDYVKSAAALEHYVRSIEPTTVVAQIRDNVISTLRDFTLMNPSTPIKSTIGQIGNSAVDTITRRLATRSAAGAAPAAKADLQRQAWKFFRDTGFNPTIMESYEDSGRLGEHRNFDVPEGLLSSHAALRAAETATRTIAKVTNKIAIDYEHVISFTKFHQMAFFDALHIGATNLATVEGKTDDLKSARVDEIMRDAAKIKPETTVGRILRADAQAQAARVTSINDTYIANFALAVKRFLNGKVVFSGSDKLKIPKTGLGDLLMPVAKIPANIIWNGIENAGVGIPIAINDIWAGKQKLKEADEKTRVEGLAQYAGGWRRLARTVGIMGAAAIFSSMFGPDDFRKDRFNNTYVKIGGVWINMEYVAWLSPAFAGFMNSRMNVNNGTSILKMVESYGAGALRGLNNAPGVDTVSNFLTSLTGNKDQLAGAWDYIRGRLVPAPVHSLMQDRPVNRLFFGAHGVESDKDISADDAAARERAIERQEANEQYKEE